MPTADSGERASCGRGHAECGKLRVAYQDGLSAGPRDCDIVCSFSIDNGASWTAPSALHADADTDLAYDIDNGVHTAVSSSGVWIAAWITSRPGLDGDTDVAIRVVTNLTALVPT